MPRVRAQPQLAGPAVGAELAGVLVDHRDLVARGDVAHRADGERSDGLPVIEWVTVSVMPYAA